MINEFNVPYSKIINELILTCTIDCFLHYHLTPTVELHIFTGQLAEEVVLTDNFSSLTKILNVKALLPQFITRRIITIDDASDIESCDQESEKVMKLLKYITRHLKDGHITSFYQLLATMKAHGTISYVTLANTMESSVAKLYKGMYMLLLHSLMCIMHAKASSLIYFLSCTYQACCCCMTYDF